MLFVVLVNILVVTLSVIIHYEFLYQTTILLPKINMHGRYRILIGVLAALVAHTIEILLFAITYLFLDRGGHWGSLEGNYEGTLLDCVYFSMTSFTTLGYGDIEPHGLLRFLAGIESLTGLVLITWTASFLFLEMQRYWIRK